MEVAKIETVMILTNPRELREIADKMEKKISIFRIGDSTITHLKTNGNLEVKIAWDQET